MHPFLERPRAVARVFFLMAAAALAAGCSGGGTSGPAAIPAAVATSSAPNPQSLPATAATGTVVDLPYDGSAAHPGYSVLPGGSAAPAGAPIAGASVYVGPTVLLGAAPPATVPAGFAYAVTAADGTFRLTNPQTGHLAITIYAPAPHTAVLHQDVTLATATSPAGTFAMTVPTAGERAWFAQQTSDRAAYGTAPTILDESAIESGRYWAAFMQRNGYFAHCIPASACASGNTLAAPASYGPQDVDPQHRFYFEHGFSGASAGENIASGFAQWQDADAAFMAEAATCPNGQPANCAFSEATGHFLNIVNAEYAWTGFGIDAPATSAAYYAEEFVVVYQTNPRT